MAESMQLASTGWGGWRARAGQGVLAGHGAELSTSREDDVRRRRRGSTMRPGRKRSATEGGLGCGGGEGMRRRDDARCGPGGWRDRAGVEDDGGAAETSSTAGRGWATEARSKMAVAAAMINV